MRFFKRNNFCLKIRFSQAQHAIFDFFKDWGFFRCDFFKIRFHRSPPQFLKETKCFAGVKDSSTFPARLRLTGDLRKIFERFRIFFSSILCFFKGFPLRTVVFLLFPVGEEWFSRLMRIPSGIFWGCKIDEILTLLHLLHLVDRMISFDKFTTFFASVCEARLRLCVGNMEA